MVALTRIYTRTGDKGTTALANGERRKKHDLRIEAYGTVDETNAAIGLARLHTDGELDAMLGRIQNELFDLGADLSTPDTGKPLPEPAALAWPSNGESMDSLHVLEQLESRFGLWVPKNSEEQRLPAAALSTTLWGS